MDSIIIIDNYKCWPIFIWGQNYPLSLSLTWTFFILAVFCLQIIPTAFLTTVPSSWIFVVIFVYVGAVFIASNVDATSCAWSSWAIVTLSASFLFTPTTFLAALTPSRPDGPSWKIKIQLKQLQSLKLNALCVKQWKLRRLKFLKVKA